jgi:hypothetical protein
MDPMTDVAAIVSVAFDIGQQAINSTTANKACADIRTLLVWYIHVLDVVVIVRGIILVIFSRHLLQIFAESGTTGKNVEIH